MDLNTTGLVAALATFLGIWLGHVTVRKIEYLSPTVWVPALVALCLGLAIEAGALLSEDLNLSAALGIFGFTLLWDALEFWRQERRVAKGHAPANPDNPRHARLLATGSPVTTIDWLKRDPQGRPLKAEELRGMQEGAG
jgi:uncharacterized membrane protein YfcA